MLTSMTAKTTLLKTKMMAPPVASTYVARERVLKVLGQAAEYKLTLLSAPAGFGKTTALTQLVTLLRKNHEVAWLSLDSGDNKSDVFFQYFIASLQHVDVSLGQKALLYMESANRFDISKTITSLVNDLVDYEQQVFLFLDDYHFVESKEIEQFIEVLLNLGPDNFHLILSSRTLPDFPIASKHAHNDVLQLSIADLRFDLDEAKQFFAKQSHKELNEQQLETLYNRSEGWAAGLQLASLYLSKSSGDKDKLVDLAGSLRDIADYLAVEVLDQQPKEIQEFLSKISILKRFNADVCNALLRRDDSQQVLQEVEALNLFIVALDEERNWYRYHHLFQQFLQTRLQQSQAEHISALYRDASNWFRQQELFHEAVDYALQGKEFDLAADLIEKYTIAEFIKGRMPQVNEWINHIPEEVKHAHPRLLLLQGTALYHMNENQEAERVSMQLANSIVELENTGAISKELRQELENENRILKAGICMSSDRNREVIELMPKPLKTSQNFILGAANNILAYSYYRLGEFDSAQQHLDAARAAHETINAQFGVVYSDCFQAMLEIAQGNLKRALEIFNHYGQSKPDEANKQIYVASVVDIMLGIIDYEMNQLEESQRRLQLSLSHLEQVGHIRLTLMGYAVLVKIAVAKSDYANAYKILDYMLLLAGAQPLNSHRLFIETLRVKVFLHDNKPAEALNLATILDVPLDEEIYALPKKWSGPEYLKRITQLRVLLQARQHEIVQQSIGSLLAFLKTCQQNYHLMEVLLLQARCCWEIGDKQQAFSVMKEFITMAAPQSMFRLLLDEGEAMHQLLKALLKQASIKEDVVIYDFAKKCCDYFEGGSSHTDNTKNKINLIEPLSPREMKILGLMSQGKSNSAIADELFISESTVKWHGGNIFGKLNVKNRTAAVITAKELKLID